MARMARMDLAWMTAVMSTGTTCLPHSGISLSRVLPIPPVRSHHGCPSWPWKAWIMDAGVASTAGSSRLVARSRDRSLVCGSITRAPSWSTPSLERKGRCLLVPACSCRSRSPSMVCAIPISIGQPCMVRSWPVARCRATSSLSSCSRRCLQCNPLSANRSSSPL